jgi:hypothetical protein
MNHLLSLILAANVYLWGPPGDILFSNQNKALDEFNPHVEASNLFKKGERIHYYIYSTKEFKTDTLYILLVHVDNKGVIFPKTEIAQTLEVDVIPTLNAAKGTLTVWKSGQFLVRVYSPDKPKKPIAQADLLIK